MMNKACVDCLMALTCLAHSVVRYYRCGFCGAYQLLRKDQVLSLFKENRYGDVYYPVAIVAQDTIPGDCPAIKELRGPERSRYCEDCSGMYRGINTNIKIGP